MKLPRSSPLPANGQGESVLRGVPKSRPESKWLRVSDVDDDDGDDDNEYDMVVMTIDFNGCLRKKYLLFIFFLFHKHCGKSIMIIRSILRTSEGCRTRGRGCGPHPPLTKKT